MSGDVTGDWVVSGRLGYMWVSVDSGFSGSLAFYLQQ